ncbi:MAG: hypothetical protein PHE20_02260 [Patescibacteria group bacterium]|nr:hypothetical protein [Patescibacteria group bacterium]
MKDNNSMIRPKMEPSLQTLTKSWGLYWRGLISFVGMYLWGLVGLIPLFILTLLAWLVFYSLDWHSFILYVLFGILGLASLAWAIYYGTRSKIGLLLLLKNNFKSVNEDFKESKKYFWRYLWASLLVSLISIALMIFFIIPGIIVAVLYSFALFVVVFENGRIFSSVEKSYDLVKRYWWPVFGRFMLLGLIAVILISVTNIPLEYLEGTAKEIYSVVFNLIWALLTPYFLVYTYFMYRDLASK